MSTTTSMRESRLLVGGEWPDADERRHVRGARSVHGRCRRRRGRRLARRCRAAPSRLRRRAFPDWAATPPAVRQGIFLQGGRHPRAPPGRDRRLLARETGCTFGFGMFQTHFTPGLLRQAAGVGLRARRRGDPVGHPRGDGDGMRQPVGVVGAIAPWNAALILSLRSITAPLAFGNTVVLKPSEWSPFTGGLLWGEIFAEAGLPAGVLNIVTHAPGEAAGIGDELVENPAVRRLNFTGSTRDRTPARRGLPAGT